jgi:lactate dehydrogenase-like 2-hydroxyacid dehydrogenase
MQGEAMKPHVLVCRRMFPEVVARLREHFEVETNDADEPWSRAELIRRLQAKAGVFVTSSEPIDAELLAACPDLKAVCSMAVGYNNIDVAACTARGVLASNAPGVLTETTADLAFALLMAGARRLPEGDRYVRAGKWKTWGPLLLLGPDVHGGTIGIVGFGRIGQAVARRARGFGMTILYHDVHQADPSVEAEFEATFLPLEELLPRADFVSLHVNLTADTKGLINAEKLGWMKRSAILVNTSRGPVVSSGDLAAALTSGQIAAAALDVTDPEPIPVDDPLVGLDNCLIVPHIASASRATRGKMAQMAAANLLAGVRGERLPTPVNPEVHDRA